MTATRPMKFLAQGIAFSALTLPVAFSQNLDWSQTSFSLTAQWISPQKDFGTYWKAGPAAGAYARIPLDHPLSITVVGLVSWHAPAETPRKANIPQVLLFQLGGGFSLEQNLSGNLDASVAVRLVNNAFIMTGPPVRPGFENAVESEFGISFEGALVLQTNSVPISLLGSYQPIFVGLDPVAIISVGLSVGLSRP